MQRTSLIMDSCRRHIHIHLDSIRLLCDRRGVVRVYYIEPLSFLWNYTEHAMMFTCNTIGVSFTEPLGNTLEFDSLPYIGLGLNGLFVNFLYTLFIPTTL